MNTNKKGRDSGRFDISEEGTDLEKLSRASFEDSSPLTTKELARYFIHGDEDSRSICRFYAAQQTPEFKEEFEHYVSEMLSRRLPPIENSGKDYQDVDVFI